MTALATPSPYAAPLEQAYQWLCSAREKSGPNHLIWHFLRSASKRLPQLLTKLTTGDLTLSPVKLVRTPDHSLLECWEPQDSLVLKATALAITPQLLRANPSLSKHCYHLKGSGGVKGAVRKLKHLLLGGHYSFIARSDAKGYYANIQHSKLLELVRQSGIEPALTDVVSQYCARTRVLDGYYAQTDKGISLGCPLSPIMGALYLHPLDQALSNLPGTRYLRYMDDWVILAESRWKLRKAVRIMNQVLSDLDLQQHPDKTFIGRTDRGFDFLGVQFTATGETSPSAVSRARHTENTARLYEQGASQERIEQYRQNWLRYLRGILGRDHPATRTRKTRSASVTTRIHQPYSVLSSREPSHHLRCAQMGAINEHKNKYEKTEQIRNLPRSNRGSRLCNER